MTIQNKYQELDKLISELRMEMDDTWEDSQITEEWILALQMRESLEE